ncbi:GD22664 [Drosophila simulans]|uniref:GD22664 n=1 Tax=Drosophila simulans TaxID=7240 RepID=B4Q3I5_DROSI|nr:GD22664 [Drosophila simulans]
MMGSRPILSLSWLLLLLCSTVCFAHPNLEIMKRMLDDMDDKAEPCHNFYNSSQKNLKWHAFATVSDQFQLLFDGIENEVFEKHSFEEKLQRLYKICSTMEGPSLLRYFELVKPGEDLDWPFLTPRGGEWPKEKFQWMEALARLRRYGYNDIMFGMSIRQDPNSGQPIVVFEKKYNFLFRFIESLQNIGLPPKLANEIAPLDNALKEMYKKDTRFEHYVSDAAPVKRISLRRLESYGVSLTKYLEIVFGRPFSPDFVVHVENLYYFRELQNLMTAVRSQVVANYLTARFSFYTMFTFMKHGASCVTTMRKSMEFASNLLFEERILGRKKLRSYQNQAGKIFDAIRQQLNIRLERNALELPPAKISLLQKIISHFKFIFETAYEENGNTDVCGL